MSGRLPKLVLDPTIQQKVVDAVRAGNYLETAAAYAGISDRTLHAWLTQGRAEEARLAEPGAKPRANAKPYVEFARAVTRARAEAETRVVAQIQSAIGTDWRAGAFWLERSFPRRWGRSQQLEHVGDGGGPISVAVQISAREELLTRLEEMRARILPALEVDAEEP